MIMLEESIPILANSDALIHADPPLHARTYPSNCITRPIRAGNGLPFKATSSRLHLQKAFDRALHIGCLLQTQDEAFHFFLTFKKEGRIRDSIKPYWHSPSLYSAKDELRKLNSITSQPGLPS